jgi:hypothetical protein
MGVGIETKYEYARNETRILLDSFFEYIFTSASDINFGTISHESSSHHESTRRFISLDAKNKKGRRHTAQYRRQLRVQPFLGGWPSLLHTRSSLG